MRTTNKLYLLGYVGQNPKTFGKTVKVDIATNRVWKDKNGEVHKETDWNTVTILSERDATWVAANVKKGDPVYVEARVAQGSYKKGDETIYTVDIIVERFDSLVPKPDKDDADQE